MDSKPDASVAPTTTSPPADATHNVATDAPAARPRSAAVRKTTPVAAGSMRLTAPGARSHSTSGWALAFALALGAGWLLWRRSRQLALETERLARHRRVLQTANDRLKNESQKLRQQAINDPLTGALNRQAFASGLRERLDHLAHYGHPAHLIVLDLDHFKAINDRHGHLAGDSALKLVTGIVHEQLVSDDLFGRFGGDEFLIACADHDLQSAAELAETIRCAVESAAPRHTPALPGLTLSMGVAQADPDSGYDADALFAHADAALYEAKRRGRNRVVVADERLQGHLSGPSGRHL